MRRATVVAACGTLGIAAGTTVAPTLGQAGSDVVRAEGSAKPEPATTATRLQRLIEDNDCWTGSAPGSVIPGRAVVSLPGRRPALVSGEVGFHLWLGQDGVARTGDERPGRLHAFCP